MQKNWRWSFLFLIKKYKINFKKINKLCDFFFSCCFIPIRYSNSLNIIIKEIFFFSKAMAIVIFYDVKICGNLWMNWNHDLLRQNRKIYLNAKLHQNYSIYATSNYPNQSMINIESKIFPGFYRNTISCRLIYEISALFPYAFILTSPIITMINYAYYYWNDILLYYVVGDVE